MARFRHGSRSELVHCEFCGEDYSATYRYCPFCGQRPDRTGFTQSMKFTAPDPEEVEPAQEEEEQPYVFEGGHVFDQVDEEVQHQSRPKGGKRLAADQPKRSPFRIVRTIFSLALIAAAVFIVFTFVRPMLGQGGDDDVNPPASSSVTPEVSPSPSVEPSPVITEEPDVTPSANPETTIPADQTATGFTLDKKEFSISERYPEPIQIKVTMIPAGSTGTLTWTSSDESVAVVSDTGLVTAVGKGSCTITATLPGGVTQSCTVVSSVVSSGPVESGTLTLNREDFTLNSTWPKFTLEATGASGDVTWKSSNNSIATVDADGTVTRVSKGRCTVTATDAAGQTAECVVRCG